VKVSSEQVARIVSEVSAGAQDPQHVASVVGAFMRRQPMIGHYLQSFQRELGLEGVVLTLLHAHVVARCVEVAAGRSLRIATPQELDAAANATGALGEPELEGYIDGNISKDDPTLGPGRDVAVRLLRLVARTLLEQVRA
jgi:hypothetical protein